MNGTSSLCRVFIRTAFRQKTLGLSGLNDEFQEQSCRSRKGVVHDIMRCKTKPAVDDIYKCFSQHVVLFFLPVLLYGFFIERDKHFNMFFVSSGIGGVSGGPLLIIVTGRVKRWVTTFTFTQK